MAIPLGTEMMFQVEQEFGIATARVGEGVKDVQGEIIHVKRQRQRQWRKVRRVRVERYERI